ncbi:Uncharacterized protein dnl_49750 [Desulfonema limicola]|uniref:Uncharacterized protein n=1 Tax=Desulfonema limicola TaxID=45656 RepID=A0A975BBY3_9BACT|nr:hypothetical protein [Desulfonema limicola]QTA82597.1 Uncharacterized protein dnl_49750 [Desulfonema limicola]
MKKILIIFAMITVLTMAAWGDIPLNSAYAATDTTEVTAEQPDAAEEETVIDEEEIIIDDEEVVIDDEEAVIDEEAADQGDMESKPAE